MNTSTAKFTRHEKPGLLSVCVSILNEENNITHCVDSIIDASENYNVEIILLDNGSSDNTATLLFPYMQNARIRVITFETTSTLNVARNYLLSQASGEYAIFLDADGQVNNDYFDVFSKLVTPNCVVYSGLVPEGSSTPNPYFDLHYKSLMESDPNFVIGANFAVNVAAALRVGGFPDITFRRGDETPLVELLVKEYGPITYSPRLVATNRYINTASGFVTSFFFEGQNSYLYTLYFGRRKIPRFVYKSLFITALILLGLGIYLESPAAISLAVILIMTKVLYQRSYWRSVFINTFRIKNVVTLWGLFILGVAHLSHEFGFLWSGMVRKKPNCWVIEKSSSYEETR